MTKNKKLLFDYKGFAIQSDYSGWESTSICTYAVLNKIPIIGVKDPKNVEDDWIPCGTVEWVLQVLATEIKPNYFPSFLAQWIKRKTWISELWPLLPTFLKPADKYKRFDGFIADEKNLDIYSGPFLCSEIISIKNEWRYYISYGEVICGHWYSGKEDKEIVAPTLKIDYPHNWCGTADFGELESGEIVLIECHHPFACGWYGKNPMEYVKFLASGWKWLKEKNYKEFE